VQTVSASTSVVADASGTVSRACPSGESVISGGFDILQNQLDITFSAKVDNSWRANAINPERSSQSLKVLTNCYSGGAVQVVQSLETAEVPAGWTWTKEKACTSGLPVMGGFASSARPYRSFFMTTNSKWKIAVFNTGDAATNFKAYFYCATFS
jgi:hypothetical protein